MNVDACIIYLQLFAHLVINNYLLFRNIPPTQAIFREGQLQRNTFMVNIIKGARYKGDTHLWQHLP